MATTIETLDITFANGYVLTGDLALNLSQYPNGEDIYPDPFNDLYVNGAPNLSQLGAPDGVDYRGLFANNTDSYQVAIAVNFGAVPNLTYGDFTISNFEYKGSPTYAGVRGTATCISGCSISPVPLPPSLPLFGSAVLALVGFGAWQSRRVARG